MYFIKKYTLENGVYRNYANREYESLEFAIEVVNELIESNLTYVFFELSVLIDDWKGRREKVLLDLKGVVKS